ncbi:MAG: HAMP domain-containing histidine kinase [Clostridiales bacterium]|nr:HAMP domain-containing histidine kinase [Clostridiales bacterium]
MADGKSTLKRFFKSHIFRITVAFIVIFGTVFFPMYFAYPQVDSEKRNIIIVLIVFACILEAIAYLLITHYFVYAKIGNAAKRLKNMTHDGNLIKTDFATIDNSADDLQSAVNATADEYARLAQVRKTFVANASHELRSPLTSVQGFLQAVLDGTASEEDKDKYLKIALSETKRLNALITSMLDLSRLDSGKNPLVRTKFDINDIINEVAAKFEPALIKKALQANVEFSRDTCYVFADKDKIIQVLTNLLDNAIKYSPAYSRIILTTSIHENKVYVTVRDFGYGISKKDQMLIWDTFYMTDKSRSPVKAKGSGLGLSIVKKIIDEHGEVVWVESSRGAGATFIFTLTLFDAAKHNTEVGKIIQAPES